MKYMLLIHQGTTPTPRDPEAWGRLSEDEQKSVFAAYQKLNENPITQFKLIAIFGVFAISLSLAF